MSDFQEGFYVVENDRNRYAAESDPVVIGGPYDSHFEAEQNCPEDGGGMEYTVDHINRTSKHNYRGV